MDVAPPDVVLEPRLLRERDAPLEVGAPLGTSQEQRHGAGVVELRDQLLGVPLLVDQLERPLSPREGRLRLLEVHRVRRGGRVGGRQRRARAEPLEDGDGVVDRRRRAGRVAGAPPACRQGAEAAALAPDVAGPAVAVERLLQRGDGDILLPRHVALERPSLEKLAARRVRQGVRVAQGPPVLRRRLAVGPDGGRPLTRRRRELEHRRDVVRGLGVMGEAREVRETLGRPPQRLQGGPVQRDAPVRS